MLISGYLVSIFVDIPMGLAAVMPSLSFIQLHAASREHVGHSYCKRFYQINYKIMRHYVKRRISLTQKFVKFLKGKYCLITNNFFNLRQQRLVETSL